MSQHDVIVDHHNCNHDDDDDCHDNDHDHDDYEEEEEEDDAYINIRENDYKADNNHSIDDDFVDNNDASEQVSRRQRMHRNDQIQYLAVGRASGIVEIYLSRFVI
jgi:hypothetical protein